MEKEENQNKEENILKKEDGSDGDTHLEKTKEEAEKEKEEEEKKKKKRKFKYTCPDCKLNVWGKEDLKIGCNDCKKNLVMEVKKDD